MKVKCHSCGVAMEIQDPRGGFKGDCPKCKAAIHIVKGAKEYKFVTQKMLCGSNAAFDVEVAERTLNVLACEGWRVVSSSAFAKGDMGFAGATYPTLLVLERDIPSLS